MDLFKHLQINPMLVSQYLQCWTIQDLQEEWKRLQHHLWIRISWWICLIRHRCPWRCYCNRLCLWRSHLSIRSFILCFRNVRNLRSCLQINLCWCPPNLHWFKWSHWPQLRLLLKLRLREIIHDHPRIWWVSYGWRIHLSPSCRTKILFIVIHFNVIKRKGKDWHVRLVRCYWLRHFNHCRIREIS